MIDQDAGLPVCDGCPEMPPGTKHPSCKMPSLPDVVLSNFVFVLPDSTTHEPLMIQFCTCASICFGGSVGFQSQELGSTTHQSSATENTRNPFENSCGHRVGEILINWRLETSRLSKAILLVKSWGPGRGCFPMVSANINKFRFPTQQGPRRFIEDFQVSIWT